MTSLTIQRHLSASPAQVWRAWTDPAEFVAWIWPPRLQPRFEADPRTGARYRLESPAAQMAVSGVYLVVDEERRLGFTWQWDGEDEQTRVTITMAAAGDGTDLAIDHEGFASDQARDDHVQGWEDCLERLPGHLARPA